MRRIFPLFGVTGLLLVGCGSNSTEEPAQTVQATVGVGPPPKTLPCSPQVKEQIRQAAGAAGEKLDCVRGVVTDKLPPKSGAKLDWDEVYDEKCASFVASKPDIDYRIDVFAHHVSCAKATEVQRAWWSADVAKQHHGGKTDAESWYTMEGFPGWRCFQGAGSGACRSRPQRVAAYENALAP